MKTIVTLAAAADVYEAALEQQRIAIELLNDSTTPPLLQSIARALIEQAQLMCEYVAPGTNNRTLRTA